MKTMKTTIFSLLMLIPFVGYADAGYADPDTNARLQAEVIKEADPNRFFIGPDLYYQEHSVGHYGLQMGYEYRRPDFVYGRFDLNTTWGNFDSDRFNFGAEGKVGYNFSPAKGLDLIPYMGFGYYQVNEERFASSKLSWKYPLLGVWVNYAFTNWVECGLNVKAMYTVNAKQNLNYFESRTHNLKNHFQYTIEIPTTFYLDQNKKWDIRMVPYFSMKDVGGYSESYHYTAVINNTPIVLSSYHKASGRDLYQVGGRIEVGYHF